MLRTNQIFILLTAIILIIMNGCSGDSSTSINNWQDNFKLIITDAPLPIDLVKSAIVTISKIELKKSNESEPDQFILISDKTVKLDLLTLRNGITKTLALMKVPNTSYKMIRLTIDSAIIILQDSREFKLDIPPNWIEITLNPLLTIQENSVSEILLDFDLSSSFELEGDPTKIDSVSGFKFNPQIRAINMTNTGIIYGKVADNANSNALYNARLWLEGQQQSEVSTFSDENGYFKIIGVPVGTFIVHCKKDGYEEKTAIGIIDSIGNSKLVIFGLNKQ